MPLPFWSATHLFWVFKLSPVPLKHLRFCFFWIASHSLQVNLEIPLQEMIHFTIVIIIVPGTLKRERHHHHHHSTMYPLGSLYTSLEAVLFTLHSTPSVQQAGYRNTLLWDSQLTTTNLRYRIKICSYRIKVRNKSTTCERILLWCRLVSLSTSRLMWGLACMLCWQSRLFHYQQQLLNIDICTMMSWG